VGTLREDLHTFMIISRSILLKMRNISDNNIKKDKTLSLYSITFFHKIVLFMWFCGKAVYSRIGHRWHY